MKYVGRMANMRLQTGSHSREGWAPLPKHLRREIVQLYRASSTELGDGRRERARNFERILRVYHPWFSATDHARAWSCVLPLEKLRNAGLLADRLQAEYGTQVLSLFGAVDKDQSGVVSIDEFEEHFASVFGGDAASLFAAADRNGDGELDIEEFFAFVARTPRVCARFPELVASAQSRADDVAMARRKLIFKPAHPAGERPALCHMLTLDEAMHAHATRAESL